MESCIHIRKTYRTAPLHRCCGYTGGDGGVGGDTICANGVGATDDQTDTHAYVHVAKLPSARTIPSVSRVHSADGGVGGDAICATELVRLTT